MVMLKAIVICYSYCNNILCKNKKSSVRGSLWNQKCLFYGITAKITLFGNFVFISVGPTDLDQVSQQTVLYNVCSR